MQVKHLSYKRLYEEDIKRVQKEQPQKRNEEQETPEKKEPEEKGTWILLQMHPSWFVLQTSIISLF